MFSHINTSENSWEFSGYHLDPPDAASGLVLWGEISLGRPVEVDRLVGDVGPEPLPFMAGEGGEGWPAAVLGSDD